jgi:hypothetical protein
MLSILYKIVFKSFFYFSLEMDNLTEFYISDEDEPQPKTRKTKKLAPRQSQIKKSNFSQVKNLNLFDKDYQKWIYKFNTKIYEHFKKVLVPFFGIFFT